MIIKVRYSLLFTLVGLFCFIVVAVGFSRANLNDDYWQGFITAIAMICTAGLFVFSSWLYSQEENEDERKAK